jgi:glycosyltransferase involved in cell wall biosynthesis
MKLLFLHRDLPPDSFTGVAIQVHRLANALVGLGHEVFIYSHSDQPEDAKYQVLKINLPGLRLALRLAPFLKRFWYPLWYRQLPTQGYDAIHVHGDGGFIQYRGNFVRTFYGTAALEYQHARTLKGKLAQGLSYWMERREARRCRLTVGISPHVAAHLQGVDRIIPCMLPQEPDASEFTKTAYPSLVYIGSRFSRKRGEVALELFQKLRLNFPDLVLTYVGNPSEIQLLKTLPEFSGVDFRTQLNQSELMDLYRRTWVYLCLSTYEGFGVGIIEAMACSCVVVTAPHPGSEYLLRNGDTGIVTPIEESGSNLENILIDHPARLEISRRAREFSKRFSPAVVGSAYAELYRVARARIGGTLL